MLIMLVCLIFNRWNEHNCCYEPETCGKVCVISCLVLTLYTVCALKLSVSIPFVGYQRAQDICTTL